MNHLFYLFAATAALAGLLASIGIWSPSRLMVKIGALTTVALFLPASYVSFSDLLSRPKPVSLEWLQSGMSEAVVLGADLHEDHAIYVWLRMDDVEEPRAYMLPWTQKSAEQLFGAQRQAEADGTQVRMRNPFDNGDENAEPVFYAQPQQPLPPKHVASSQPVVYNR